MLNGIWLYATLGTLHPPSPIEQCREFTPAFCVRDSDLKIEKTIHSERYAEYKMYKSYWSENYYTVTLPRHCDPRGEWSFKGVNIKQKIVYYGANGCKKLSVKFSFRSDAGLDDELTSWFTEIRLCRSREVCEVINADIVGAKELKHQLRGVKMNSFPSRR